MASLGDSGAGLTATPVLTPSAVLGDGTCLGLGGLCRSGDMTP